MHYFIPPYTEARIKEQYRSLAKRFHPDKAGNAEVMAKVNEEKELLLKLAKLSPVPNTQTQQQPKKKFATKKVLRRRPRVMVVFPEPDKILKILKELRKFK